MYRLTVDSVESYLVVMRNIFSNHLRVHKKYDLKGSTVDREASQKEREKDHPTFKDNDFLNDGAKIHIGEEAKEKLMKTLQADVEFLSGLHIMDYSLLLGVHDVDAADDEEECVPQEGDDGDEEEGLVTLPYRIIITLEIAVIRRQFFFNLLFLSQLCLLTADYFCF